MEKTARISLRKKKNHPVYRIAYGLAYLVDLAMAPRVNPRETLLVSGFWRSGTTWIQNSLAELLNAKIIFEPYHYYVPEMKKALDRLGVTQWHPRLNMFMPGSSGESFRSSPYHAVIRKAIRSTLRGRWVRLYRLHWQDARRTQVIVKFTRAALTLRAMQDASRCPVLHISRDPRAVIASVIYKTKNMNGRFTPAFSLTQDLLKRRDGLADYFKTWRSEIKALDKQSLAIKMAAYWALTERFLADSYGQAAPARTVFAQYEDLAQDPEIQVARVIDRLGYPLPDSKCMTVLHAQSLTSVPTLNQSPDEMIRGWRSIVPASEAAEIGAIARDFGLADRLRD